MVKKCLQILNTNISWNIEDWMTVWVQEQIQPFLKGVQTIFPHSKALIVKKGGFQTPITTTVGL